MGSAENFVKARDFLIENRENYEAAYKGFKWPVMPQFNWALDFFDREALGNDGVALWVVEESGAETRLTFAELSGRSNRVANFLRRLGVKRGDRILIMLPNVTALWEITLAAIKLGAVVGPATTLLAEADLADRIERGGMRVVVTDPDGAPKFDRIPGDYTRIMVGGSLDGWISFEDAFREDAGFSPDGPTGSSDPFLLYFTSGTTAKPKMVQHSHASYPVGHLSTMYWVGLKPGDIHFNISSPGWAKHAWSSFFAPWNAGATVFVYNQARFDPQKTLSVIARSCVTTLCAPPTVWRSFILEDLKSYPVKLRELVGAGEPLNPEVIDQVKAAWGLTIRDGYGQTETTCQVGNSPGQPVKPGSMGRPMPGYAIALVDVEGKEADEGEIGIRLNPAPVGIMTGYLDNPERTSELLDGDYFLTSDVAGRDKEGYFWYVGRADDVFKSSDYRISPFELESALIEHEWVAEAAVVPSPDPIKLSVPKAYVMLKPGIEPSKETAFAILKFLRDRLAPYTRVRRIEFAELPKTISGKIRRVDLRKAEEGEHTKSVRGQTEFWESDFPDLKG